MAKRISTFFQNPVLSIGIIFFVLVVGLTADSLYRFIAFSQCVQHKSNSKTHTHATLVIEQDGRQIVVPANLGITPNCMHPLHTHDATGLIHMEYPLPFNFYLGDFFDVMGIVMNDKRVGALKTMDGYKIEVIKNKQLIKAYYRAISLHDLDSIRIRITSPQQ